MSKLKKLLFFALIGLFYLAMINVNVQIIKKKEEPAPTSTPTPFIVPMPTDSQHNIIWWSPPVFENTTGMPVICDSTIDVVYTWVNGSDPINIENRIKRGKKFKNAKEVKSSTETSQRYRDLETLKYSLRSIKQFAPFVNNIWIITANQIPTWFNTSYEGNIEFIFHEELFLNNDDLPTFNSNAIEANLHSIPSRVADCFLFLNDDILFGNDVVAEDFFDGDKIAVYPESWTAPSNLTEIWHLTINYTNQNLDRVWNETKDRYYASHGVHPMYRRTLEIMHEELKFEIENTSASPFRDEHNMQTPFMNQQYNMKYFNTFPPGKVNEYFTFEDSEETMDSLFLHLFENRYKSVCLNDRLTENPPQAVLDKITNFFEEYYPDKGDWEL